MQGDAGFIKKKNYSLRKLQKLLKPKMQDPNNFKNKRWLEKRERSKFFKKRNFEVLQHSKVNEKKKFRTSKQKTTDSKMEGDFHPTIWYY